MKKLLIPIFSVMLLLGCGNQAPSIDIWSAAATGNIDALEEHLEFGTDLNAKETANGGTPLIVAAAYGQPAAANLLIEHGANLNAKNNDGATALHVAAFFAQPAVVELLLEADADVDVKNNSGQTALETVSIEWTNELEQLYIFFGDAMQMELDLEQIQANRVVIASMLIVYETDLTEE